MPLRSPTFLAAAILLCILPACRPTSLAGESVGQYSVRGALQSNECGQGYPVPEGLWFHVELRAEAGSGRGYWKLPDQPLASGTLDPATGAFRFEDRQQVTATEPEPGAGVAGCVLERLETVEGTLRAPASADAGGLHPTDAGTRDAAGNGADAEADADGGGSAADEAELIGTTTVRISAAEGDCGPLLEPEAGGFPALPCSILYGLEGQRLEEPLF